MKILIVSYYFPPFNTVGAIRAGKMAKYFHKMGHDVRVIAANDPFLAEPLPKTLAVEIPKEQIHYTDWIDLNKWTRSIYQKIFKRKNISITVHHKSVAKKAGLAHLITQTMRSIINIPDAKIGWKNFAIKEASEMIKNWKPDIIYATALPLTSIIVGGQIAKKYKIPFIAEFRDLWVFSHDYAFQNWRKKIDHIIERKYLESAKEIITVSEALAQTLENAYHKNVRVVYNGYDPDDFIIRTRGENKKLTLVYTGTMYFPFQNPKILFEAFQGLSSNEIEMHIFTDLSSKEYLVDEVQKYGLSDKVFIHPKISQKEAIQKQCEADILIHFLWEDANQKGIYSAKLLEYIGAGRPVFAVGVKNDIGEFVENSGLGHAFSETKNLVQALKSALENKKNGGKFESKVREEVKTKFSRKTQAEQMISIFNEVINKNNEQSKQKT